MIEYTIRRFKDAGTDIILTVVGHRAEDLIPVIETTPSRYVINNNYRDGMYSSIQKGAIELQGGCDAFFLLPVDIPFVTIGTIWKLKEEFVKDSSTLICYPQFKSRRGHPPLIDSSIIPHILTYEGTGGMRGLLGTYLSQAVDVSVEDQFVCMDADTEKDLARLKDEFLK